MTVMSGEWKWPGSRWWKCDLHLHTPQSYDFEERGVDPETWVASALAAGLDAVAVTDHNSGDWIDLVALAAARSSRTLAVFPGVELTVQGGVHLLVLFDPGKGKDAVSALLGKCDVPDQDWGKEGALAACSFVQALEHAVERGGLCIAPHVDGSKGAAKVFGPGQTLQRIISSEHLSAVEEKEPGSSLQAYFDNSKEGYKRSLGPLPRVTFSDAHRLEDIGRRSTWIKMTRPDFEGLRLALEDGPQSVIRSAEAIGDPNAHATEVIESIEISKAKYMGRDRPLTVCFNPWLNAIVGGRGTGKSSLVEFLRIALRRERELSGEIAKTVRELKQSPQSRTDRGLLTEETSFRVIYRKAGFRFRVQWDASGSLTPIEEELADGSWRSVGGEIERKFPVRIYSQKQIFELAQGPQALLKLVVDAAQQVGRSDWEEKWKLEESRFLALRAKAREVEARLAEEDRLASELEDVHRKLAVFESSGHSEVLRQYQLRRRQERAIEAWGESFAGLSQALQSIAAEAVPSSLEADLFGDTETDRSLLQATEDMAEKLRVLRQEITDLASKAETLSAEWQQTSVRLPWATAVRDAENVYEDLIAHLRAEGAGDPTEYGRLVQERQVLERRQIALEGERKVLAELAAQSSESLEILLHLRRELTRRRAEFLRDVIGTSPHVRIEALPYGDEEDAERELRSLLQTDRFEDDFRTEDGQGGIIPKLYRGYLDTSATAGKEAKSEDVQRFEQEIQSLKRHLVEVARNPTRQGTVRDQRFAKRLAGLKPETFDRLAVWFPEDSLRVTYGPGTDGTGFRPLEQGSPGQKAAAILAFLLSYGREPLILDQPEDDLDNHLISGLIVRQLRDNKRQRQLIVVTHNPNIVVNGDAELILALDVRGGQTQVLQAGGLQEMAVREEVCRVMEGGWEALTRRYRRIGRGASHV